MFFKLTLILTQNLKKNKKNYNMPYFNFSFCNNILYNFSQKQTSLFILIYLTKTLVDKWIHTHSVNIIVEEIKYT